MTLDIRFPWVGNDIFVKHLGVVDTCCRQHFRPGIICQRRSMWVGSFSITSSERSSIAPTKDRVCHSTSFILQTWEKMERLTDYGKTCPRHLPVSDRSRHRYESPLHRTTHRKNSTTPPEHGAIAVWRASFTAVPSSVIHAPAIEEAYDLKLLSRTAERVRGRSIKSQFGGIGIEKLPLSATYFDSERSPSAPGREHFVPPQTASPSIRNRLDTGHCIYEFEY